MTDIVERLRKWHTPGETITGDVQLYLEAADEIERLREQAYYLRSVVRRLRAEKAEAADEIERLRHENALAHKLIDEMTDERSESLEEIELLRERCERMESPARDCYHIEACPHFVAKCKEITELREQLASAK